MKDSAGLRCLFLAFFPCWVSMCSAEALFFTGSSSARSTDLIINTAAVDKLRSGAKAIELTVPLITGTEADFYLVPMPVLTSDSSIIVIGDNNTTRALPLPETKTWFGYAADNPSRALFLSAKADGSIRTMITGDEETSVTVIAPEYKSLNYRVEPASLPPRNYCDIPEGVFIQDGDDSQKLGRSTRTDVVYEIEMMVDIGYNLYNYLEGDETLIADYVVDLFGAVSAIYKRDVSSILSVKHVFVWATPDPFLTNSSSDSDPSITTLDQLQNYKDYVGLHRNGYNSDLAHLVDRNTRLGGRAYLRVLGSSQAQARVALSNTYAFGFPDDISTYYWDTKVVSHEIGHNVGSQHTHCYSPPIDCCALEQGCSGCTAEVAEAGTIMSYCHLKFGSGGSILMEFHERAQSLMKYYIEASAIVDPYVHQADIVVEGVNGILAVPSSTESGPGTLLESRAVGGDVTTATFTIKNYGTEDLLLLGNEPVQLTGSEYLSIISQPVSTVVAPGAKTEFVVQFNPVVPATHIGNVRILTNDPDTPSYRFVIEGRIVTASEPFTFTFTGATELPDGGGNWTIFGIDAAGVPGKIADVDVRINGSDCSTPEGSGIQHEWVGDLELMLLSPSGTFVRLLSHPGTTYYGAGGQNFCGTVLDDHTTGTSIQNIETSGAPYTNSFKPLDSLSKFDGEKPNGRWQLYCYDWRSPYKGVIRSVSIILRGEVAHAGAHNWTIYD